MDGGPFKPYPNGGGFLSCDYKNAVRGDTVARYDRNISVAQWIVCPEVPNTPIPPYERGTTEADCDSAVSCKDDYICADGVTPSPFDCIPWIGAGPRQYSLVGDQANSVPLQNTSSGFHRLQSCITAVIASGGIDYVSGELLYISGGTVGDALNAGGAVVQIGAVDLTGKMLSASIYGGGL